MSLRPYQTKGVDLIREEFYKGNKKVLLWMATGGGKTATFCHMIKEASLKGKYTLTLVRGRKLVDQASKRLFREHVPHGVIMSGHWNSRPSLSNQVASIDTLISRGIRPKADLIIIDEAHLATSDGYIEVLSAYPNAFIVAVTATPYTPKGLSHIADSMVKPISMLELIELGFLVPFRYFAPSEPDLSEVKISSSTKDYVTNDLEKVMISGQLTGKIIDHYIKIANGLPAICFGVNIKHSKMLAEKFNEAGIPAEHCDAEYDDEYREKVIARLESGEIKVICNVGIFCTGVDIPCIGAIIMARPTKSKNLYIQQAGRGTRPSEGKSNCILLDHAGNIKQHGLPTDEPNVDLEGRVTESHDKRAKFCRECFAIFEENPCPECGWAPAPGERSNTIVEGDGELKELKDIELDPILRSYKELIKEARKTGKKKAWAYHRLVSRFGFEEAKPYLPQYFVDNYENKNTSMFLTSRFSGAKQE